jgi:hypothetical protein
LLEVSLTPDPAGGGVCERGDLNPYGLSATGS